MNLIIAAVIVGCGFLGWTFSEEKLQTCGALAKRVGTEAVRNGLAVVSSQAFPVPGLEAPIEVVVLGAAETGKIEIHAMVPDSIPSAAEGLIETHNFQKVDRCMAEDGEARIHLVSHLNVLPQKSGRGI